MADTMKAWQYNSTSGGLEKNLFLPAGGVPKPKASGDQLLVEVISMAINPADYKVPELGLIAKPMVSLPASPGMDFCGRVASVGSKAGDFKEGELVFGALAGPQKYGSLGQFIVVSTNHCAKLPDGIDPDHGAAMGVAAASAYQSIAPNVKEGDKIFINGGSGGCGIWGIQIAKALGCHVTTSCSTANVDLCKSLWADEVLDYKSVDIIKSLTEKGQIFTFVVDNVGTPTNLYKASNSFLLPTGKFVQVGLSFSLTSAKMFVGNMLIPGFLGGGKAKYQNLMYKPVATEYQKLGEWAKEGKIRAVLDSIFEYDDAPKAFEKLRTGRAKGKIVVRVTKK